MKKDADQVKTAAMEMLVEVCLNNRDALQFCVAFLSWLHWIDDAQDRDVTYTAEASVRINLEMGAVFSFNPFFAAHSEGLLALIGQSFLAWEDSEEWAQRSSSRDREASQVLKATYHQVFWHVAFLVGGLDHARQVAAKHRSFDYDLLTTQPGQQQRPERHADLELPVRHEGQAGGDYSNRRCTRQSVHPDDDRPAS